MKIYNNIVPDKIVRETQLNDDILSTSRIRDVQFTFFSVVRQQ